MSKRQVLLEFVGSQEWDSAFVTSDYADEGNVVLALRVKVYFHPVELLGRGPAAGHYPEEDARFGTRTWNQALWDAWIRRLREAIEYFWNHRYWLITPDDYEGFDRGVIRPNVACKLELLPLPGPAGAHHVFNVIFQPDYYLNRAYSGGTGYTSWMAETLAPSIPGSEARIAKSSEVSHLFDVPLESQQTFLLGRNFRLQTPLAASANFQPRGQQAWEDRDMCNENAIRQPWHAKPWRTAVAMHTRTKPEDWKIVMERTPPRRLG